ncbi:MAG: domain containing protein [Acidobacteriaceae bacterium]|nr:domain containing protein [Acidobacteriaceae bacterium]
MTTPFVEAVFVGRPKAITDGQGTWVSSILRDAVFARIEVGERGLVGDQVAQPYHGSPDAAICAHLLDHYLFWNAHLGMRLAPGMVGENITLADITEDQICAGDVISVGTAILQVSGPRIPCANLARRIGRPDWLKLTLNELRTGFYLRVLEPGFIERGERWLLRDRPATGASNPANNRCKLLAFDPENARSMLEMQGLGEWWKERAQEKLEAHS